MGVERRVRTIAAMLVPWAVLAVAACGGPVDRDAPAPARASSYCYQPTPGPDQPVTFATLTADFVPVRASRCIQTIDALPGYGTWLVYHYQEATDGLDALTNALRQPSMATGGGGDVCPAIGYPVTVVTLTDARGHDVTPSVPVGQCGVPIASVLGIIESTPWRTVSSVRVRQEQSQAEIDSGCAGDVKPLVPLAADEDLARTPVGPVFTKRPTKVTVCWYDLDPTQSLNNGPGHPSFHDGRLTTTSTLSGPALTAILSAWDSAPAAMPCDQPESPFAVIRGTGSDTVVVELGGCLRVLDSANALRQLTPAAVAQLRTA